MSQHNQTVAASAAVFVYLIALSLLTVFSNDATAQSVKVRDAQSPALGTPVELPKKITPVVKPTPSVNEKLFDQLQILQREVLQLRGQVEQQGHEIKKLKQQRLEDYLDLDRRIGEINAAAGQASHQQGADAGNRRTPPPRSSTNPPNGKSGSGGQLSPSKDERERYRTAIDQVLKKQDYPAAQSSFSDYLTRYPQGYYKPNIHYWQGEIFLLQGETDKATTAFGALINQYPKHSKTPDAKYKLAKLYFQQGKKDEAKKLLEVVVQSGSDASRLAQSFLERHY